MMFIKTPEFRVGLMVLTILGIIAMMSMKVSEDPGILGGSKRAWFLLEDASGLVKGSAIKMAGVDVGIIKNIRLKGNLARIDISIDKAIPISNSAWVEIRAHGILGDKYVEVVGGNPQDPPLKDEAQILKTIDQGSMNVLVNEISKVATSISEVAQKLKTALDDVPDQKNPLGRIVKNIEDLTRDISEITSTNKNKIADIVDRVNDVTKTLDELVNDGSPEGLKKTWKRVVKSLNRIDVVMRNVEEITDKVNNGKGTIGRLINDEDTVDKIENVADKVAEVFDTASKIETSLDFHSEYLTSADSAKSFLGVKIQPGLDRYYEVQIIDDAKGVTRLVDTSTVTNGGPPTEVMESKTFKDRVKYTALFAKNYYDLTVKGGLIENRGGVGFDYFLAGRKLRVSLEAFDFQDLYIRSFARYQFMRGVYLIGGGDDLLDSANSSAFIGAGIFLTNDDLKLLLSKASF